MKLRGKKRYYRNLSNEQIPDWINFEDNNKNWFDFYHHHIFNKDIKNKSWKSRKQHLDALFSLAEKYENRLKNMSREFQFWICINEIDSNDDAIYIHTENPNKSDFPISVQNDKNIETENKLEEYLKNKKYNIIRFEVFDMENKKSINYYLQKENLGLMIK